MSSTRTSGVGSSNKLDPHRYTDIRQATTMPGLPDSAYKVKAAQEKQTGKTRYFYRGKQVSDQDGFAISTGKERVHDLGVFQGVDIGPDGKIRR